MPKNLITKEGIVTTSDGKVYIFEVSGDTDYNPEELTVSEVRSKYTDLEGALPLLNVRYKQYVRRLVVEGSINAVKIAIKGSVKWFLEIESIKARAENTSRSSGVRSYKLYIPEEYEGAVRKAIEAVGKKEGFTVRFERAYNPKKK